MSFEVGNRGLVVLAALRLPLEHAELLQIGSARFEMLGEPGVEIGEVINNASTDLRKAWALAAAAELNSRLP
jgi:hypothetical protein